MFVIINESTGKFFKRLPARGKRLWVGREQATRYRRQPLATLFYMTKRGLDVRVVRG